MQSSSGDDAVSVISLSEIQLYDLAKDLFLYRHDSEGVLRAHGISEDYFTEVVLANPVFVAAAREISEQVKKGPHAAIRMAAGDALREQIPVIHSIVMDGSLPAADRIKAADWIARMADANPKESKVAAASGTTLNVHIGPKQTTVDIEQ